LLAHILCPVDVEQPTSAPLLLAGAIAERFGASLEALYVGSSDAEPRLQELARGLKSSISVTTRLVQGTPAEAILERACQPGCDLLVLGARQRSDLGWQFRDDVTRNVAAMAPCATLTVHERDMHETIERILIPIDFTPVTPRALDWAVAFALKFGAQLQLLHVVSRERSMVRSTDRAHNVTHSSNVPTNVTAELAELAQRLLGIGVQATSDVVIASTIANGIADYNDRGEFDLLVLGMGGPPETPSRLTRGTVATLRNRMSVPILSARMAPYDLAATDSERPRRREANG
jgi:nucleotide-binding universal stress UspA family protein